MKSEEQKIEEYEEELGALWVGVGWAGFFFLACVLVVFLALEIGG